MPVLGVVIGVVSVGIAVLLVKLLSPSLETAPWQAAGQATGVAFLWFVWVWLLRLPQSADGWTMHALEGSYWGVIFIAVFLLLFPVLLVTTIKHARYFLKRFHR
jgi:hypothetical protein